MFILNGGTVLTLKLESFIELANQFKNKNRYFTIPT